MLIQKKLLSHQQNYYFAQNFNGFGGIQDDHLPFLKKSNF